MDPTLRQIEYAVAVAERGSFRAAARACHVTQPGLSTQVRQLEDQLGVRLFERNRRRVLVTAPGEEVLRRARVVLQEVEHLKQAARGLARPFSGPLRLGVIPTIAPYLLPRALPKLRRRYPELSLKLCEAQTGELVDLLRRGDLDLLLVALEAELSELAKAPLFSDPFCVALPAGHALEKRRQLREDDLRGEDVLLLSDGHCLRDQVLSVCDSAGAVEPGDFRATSLATLVQMVAAGSGITLLPALALPVEARTRGLVTVPFRKPAPARTIGLAWRPDSPRAGEFRELGALFAP
jgi:LysR family hydrogen peroxide-inducible transcriptional activator